MIQDIKRAATLPPYMNPQDTVTNIKSLVLYLRQLTQQVNEMNGAINALTVTVGAGAGTTAVTLPAARNGTGYCISAVPDWNTTVWVSAVTTTGFTANYGTVAPGGGGTLRVIIVA